MVRDILASAGGVDEKLEVEDVFSTYLYTGNGATQTINNGIDLAGKGGMVWFKGRSVISSNALYDTPRGVSSRLITNVTNGVFAGNLTSFNSNGVTLSAENAGELINATGDLMSSWTFRKAPKFFDIVTYTGNGVAGRQIPHNLGCEVGMIVVKTTSTANNWSVYHRSTTATNIQYLDLTNATSTNTAWNNTEPTSSSFTVGSNLYSNANGVTYVAYLFAHDPSADGLIQCGSFTDSGAGTTVTLGFEPQWMMIKSTDSTGNWITIDNMRRCSVGGIDAVLFPNLSNAESVANDYIDFTPTGFISKNLTGTYIYTVIRRPMKTPTSGTEVYNNALDSSYGTTHTVDAGFSADALMALGRNGTTTPLINPRLTSLALLTYTTASEYGAGTITYNWGVDANKVGMVNAGGSSTLGVNHFFKRAKGFFDVVCYTGNGVAGRTVNHNLGVVPEMIIAKTRTFAQHWIVLNATSKTSLYLNLTNADDPAFLPYGWGNNTSYVAPTETVFTVGNQTYNNQNTIPIVAYLFATLAGISKVGSYTGNGTSQTINCGFTTGARFVLIKRTNATGDWYIWDTTRGIVAANDPHLSLNTTAAQVTTDDSVDPAVEGFIVNQNTATNINVNGGSYIFLAIA